MTSSRLLPRLFISRDFGCLWTAQAASSFGEYFLASTVTVWLITDLASGLSVLPALVAGVVLTATLPRLVIAPLVGVFVDRWRASTVMVLSDLVRVALVLPMILVAAFADDTVIIAALLVLLTMVGVTSQFFMPARAAALQEILPEDRRADGAGKMMFAAVGIAVAATTAGPAVYATLGPFPALIANALAFLLSAVCITQAKGARAVKPDANSAGRYWPEFRAGLSTAVQTASIRVVLGGVAIYGFSLGINNAVLALFALETLSLTPIQYGVVSGAFSLGALVGSVLAPRITVALKPRTSFVLGIAAMGAAYIAYSQVRSFEPAIALMATAGVAFSLYIVSQGPILQAATPRGFMGRVTSVTTPTLALTSLLGTAGTGWYFGFASEDPASLYSHAILAGALLLCLGAALMYGAGGMVSRKFPRSGGEN